MKKVIRLTESELVNVIKRVLSEESEDGTTPNIKRYFSDIQSWEELHSLSDEEHDLLLKRQQIKDIIDNFEDIDCDNYMLGDWKQPEHIQIYCDSYRGRSKKYMQNLLNSL